MLLNELEINASDKFARKMSEMIHHIAQAWRVKTNIIEKLDEDLDAINRKKKILTDSIMELEFEIQERMATKKKENVEAFLHTEEIEI